VQARLLLFAQDYSGWESLNRGRKPNAGIYGNIGKLHGSIQATALEEDWGKLPNNIKPEMEFSIWCSISTKSVP